MPWRSGLPTVTSRMEYNALDAVPRTFRNGQAGSRKGSGVVKGLDQFYTRPGLARHYVESLSRQYDLSGVSIVEPSAGAGAFVRPLLEQGLNVSAWDLEPRSACVKQGDFLAGNGTVFPDSDRIAVIGNPPFGFASNVAIRFFNRAAEQASLIAFIVPRTFRKVSIQDKLDRHFWLVHDEDVPAKSFLRNGRPHDVPCAWQVWEWRERKRPITPTPDVSGVIAYVGAERADFGLRRVGGRAGAVLPMEEGPYNPRTTYFLHAVRPDAADLLEEIDWTYIRNSTAGVRSISKREVALELARVM